MQSSLEFYLSPQVSNLDIPFDVRSNKLDAHEEVLNCRIFQRHVQHLFNYGMHMCGVREIVMESMVVMFVLVRKQNVLPRAEGSVRLSLFKGFRKCLAEKMFTITNLQQASKDPGVSNDAHVGPDLSPIQREALFLKITCDFSYQEVAAIMGIRIKSVCNLVSQVVENLRGQRKDTWI